MRKGGKLKSKSKSAAGSDEEPKTSTGDKIVTVDQAEQAADSGGWGVTQDEKIDHFGAAGWGTSAQKADPATMDEEWKTDGGWDNPPPNLGA